VVVEKGPQVKRITAEEVSSNVTSTLGRSVTKEELGNLWVGVPPRRRRGEPLDEKRDFLQRRKGIIYEGGPAEHRRPGKSIILNLKPPEAQGRKNCREMETPRA